MKNRTAQAIALCLGSSCSRETFLGHTRWNRGFLFFSLDLAHRSAPGSVITRTALRIILGIIQEYSPKNEWFSSHRVTLREEHSQPLFHGGRVVHPQRFI